MAEMDTRPPEFEALDEDVHGVNLVKGLDFVNYYVQEKSPFWDFPMDIVHSQEDYLSFYTELMDNTKLIEIFRTSSSPRLYNYGSRRLVKSLLYCEFIKVLEVTYCEIGSNKAATKAIAEFIAETPCCSTIDVSGNRFSLKNCESIFGALENNRVVLEFRYNDNRVGDKHCKHIRHMLRSNDSLDALFLEHNPFKKDGERDLLNGLVTNESLKLLKYSIKDKNNQVIERLKTNKLNWRQKFIKDLKKEETGKWNRSKLMFIGQGRAGKTSTVRRLLSKGFDSAEDSTVGASVQQTQTSTTQEQTWKEMKESDPEYLGTGMLGNRAGQLFAARNMVGKVDELKKAKLEQKRARKLEKNKADKRKLIAQRTQGAVAIGMSETARKMLDKQKEKEKEMNQLLLDQEAERAREGTFNPGTINQDEELARQIQMQQEAEAREQARLDREAEDDTAKHYADTVFAAAREKRDTITFSLWDYGGQTVFYALHHLFLTKYGVYVLCVDLTEIINRPLVAKEYLSFWLNSVKLHAPTAPVLLVGTHLDSLEGDKKLEQLGEVNDFVEEHFSKKFRQLTSVHPKYLFYPVDNKNNKGVNELRHDVEKISRQQKFVTADVSIKWMFCLDKIMVKRDAGGKAPAYMKLGDVKKLAESVNINGHEDLERMLTMFHELGVLVRLTGTEELRNLITLDPQWLLDGLCKVIRDERLHGYSDDELDKVGLKNEMNMLFKQGLASDDVLRYLWREDGFKNHQNYLVDLMKFMVLISDWDFRDDKMYIIPSLLIPRPEDDNDLFAAEHIKLIEEDAKKEKSKRKFKLFTNKKKQKKEELAKEKDKAKEKEDEEEEEIVERTEETTVDYVVFDFAKVFLPMGVFQRLVCMCVSYSTDLGKTKKKVREPELFARWAKIWMGNNTILYLEQKEDTIWLSVEDATTGPTCFKAVNSMLTKLNADLMGSGLEWDISMQQVRRKIYQKKGEKAQVTNVTELDMTESEAKKKNLQPWYKPAKSEDAVEVEKEMEEELLDLENFVDSF